MSKADYLVEFDKLSEKPKLYKLTLSLALFIIATYLLWLFPALKIMFLAKSGLEISKFYFTILILIYPVIGLYGYTKTRKYGWFILTHYTLTSILIISILLYKVGNFKWVADLFYLKVAALYLSIICTFLNSVFLFREDFRHLFGIKRKHVLSLVLLFIVFIIVHVFVMS